VVIRQKSYRLCANLVSNEKLPITNYQLQMNGSNPVEASGGPAEEIERRWLTDVYAGRGDTQKQLTLRAVLMGGVLGMLMSLSNLYTMLKLGGVFGVAITACILSFLLWNVLRALSGGRLSQMSILENNCMQSTASAAGYSTGGTVATALGALLLIQGVHQPWQVVAMFAFFTAALGVFLAVPLKRQMIDLEQLKFPSGIAAAMTLRSLYSHGAESLQKARALLLSLAAGGLAAWLRNSAALVNALRKSGHPQVWLEKVQGVFFLPEMLNFPPWLNPIARGQMTGLAFEPGLLLIGAGMLAGTRVSLSMLAGSVLLYYGVVPRLLALDLAHVGAPGYLPSFTLRDNGDFNPIRWALWGGTSVMLFASLTQMALQWRTLARAFGKSAGVRPSPGAATPGRLGASGFSRTIRRSNVAGPGDGRTPQTDPLANIEVPFWWLVAGLAPITIGLVAVQYVAFHISIALGLLSVAFSFIVSLVCCRATGETDNTPIGAMGKLTQLLYAVIPGASGIASINLMAAGTTAAAGTAAADLLTDLKSGYLLGANPRKQFLAQFIGVFFGTVAVVPAWFALVPNKQALEAFNPPATNMWKAVADLLTQGIQMLPPTARWAIVIGALVGMALPLAEKLFPKAKPYLPSAMGLGLSWVMVFQNTLSFALGGVILAVWHRVSKKNSDLYSIPIASGFVAGESLIAALIAIACTAVGLLAIH
jgi:uncharacterized oligopeptide transporter (OPT) family protein